MKYLASSLLRFTSFYLVFICVPIGLASAESPNELSRNQVDQQLLALEAEGIDLVERNFSSDRGAYELVARYREQTDNDLRLITFNALAVYVEQTLGPKLALRSDPHVDSVRTLKGIADKHFELESDREALPD